MANDDRLGVFRARRNHLLVDELDSSDDEFEFGPYAAIRHQNRMTPARQATVEEAQVEEGWKCPICLEADGGRIVFHACGNRHAFHQACLNLCVRRDCPLCRGGPRPRQELHIGIHRVMLTSSTACVFCHRLCLGPHVVVDSCGHHLHDDCAMSIIMELGLPTNAQFRCPRCMFA